MVRFASRQCACHGWPSWMSSYHVDLRGTWLHIATISPPTCISSPWPKLEPRKPPNRGTIQRTLVCCMKRRLAMTNNEQAKTLQHGSDNVERYMSRQEQALSQGQGRERAIQDTRHLTPEPPSKQQQTSRQPTPKNFGNAGNAVADNSDDASNAIEFWIQKDCWPSHLFEPDMQHLLARKQSPSVLSAQKRSNSASSTTPSDQKPREEKSAQYRDQRYEILLATKGSFMSESKLGVADESRILCQNLLEKKQVVVPDISSSTTSCFRQPARRSKIGTKLASSKI